MRRHLLSLKEQQSDGFALPAIILTGAALIIASLVISQSSVALKQTLDSQLYNSLATDAAKAGVRYAESCRANGTVTWTELRPDTSCTSTSSTGNAYVFNANQVRSKFNVGAPLVNSTSTTITSTGIVEILGSGGSVVKTFSQKSSINVNSTVIETMNPQVLSSGDGHSCSIANSRAYCWGVNTNGELGDGTLVSRNTAAQVDVSGVLSGKTVTDLSVGTSHTCAIADGAAYCWGLGASGQLGNNSTASSSTPVAVTASGVLSGKTVTDIAAGGSHTCAIANGAAFCWGSGTNGRLGNSGTTQSNVPVTVTATGALSGRALTKMAAGNAHTCVIANGAAVCWGQGTSGQLGNGNGTASTSPVAATATGVLNGRKVTDVAAGTNHSCVVANGAAFCWGAGGSGRLGNSATTQQNSPVAVTTTGVLSGLNVSDITAGGTHTCAVANGSAYCWGLNSNSQLGNGGTTLSNVPVAVTTTGALNGKAVTSIHGGTYNTCAIAGGSAYCWGNNGNGQLGDDTTTNRSTAVLVAGFTGNNRAQVSVGSSTSCGVSNGQAYCWGSNFTGQLGRGDFTDIPGNSSPVAVKSSGLLANKRVSSISVGSDHACAIANGTVYCWGSNEYGQLGIGSTGMAYEEPVAVSTSGVLSGKTVTSVSAGHYFTCAIANGAAYCWGQGSNGKLGNGATSNSDIPVEVTATGVISGRTVTSINAGTQHACIAANGAAFCWGLNSDGRLGNNTTTTNSSPVTVVATGALNGRSVTAIATGVSHSCAIANGAAFCWGSNASNALGDGTTNQRAAPVAVLTTGSLSNKTVTEASVGDGSSCVVANSELVCWGNNFRGKLGDGTTATKTQPQLISGTSPLGGKTISGISLDNALHTCVLANSTIYCWGRGDTGQLGSGAFVDSTTPVSTINGAMPSNPTPPSGTSSAIQF